MTIIWTPQAIEHLNKLSLFLSDFLGRDEANKFKQELIVFTRDNLGSHPERFPPCNYQDLQEAGYRCLKFKKKYIVVYKRTESKIRIIGVGSSKQDPEFFNSLLP